MWKTLIEVIERYWKEKPRKELLSSLVTLRKCMYECQSYYELYEVEFARQKENNFYIREDKSIESQLERTYKDWIKSLVHLGEAVYRVDDVLAIFSPEARTSVKKYFLSEDPTWAAIPYSMDFMENAARELGQPTGIETGLDKSKLEPTFKEAIQRLDRFIKDNFKPEEVHGTAPLW